MRWLNIYFVKLFIYETQIPSALSDYKAGLRSRYSNWIWVSIPVREQEFFSPGDRLCRSPGLLSVGTRSSVLSTKQLECEAYHSVSISDEARM
jgi:hypothetical protein